MSGSRPDFRALLARASPLYCAWLGIGAPLIVEIVADAGWTATVIDQQHGSGGNAELVACLTAARAAGIPAIVRVPGLDAGQIGRALDAGAQGVMVPMIDTAEDAWRLVAAVKYPPLGVRSFGPYRGKYLVGGDYAAKANGWTIACGQIETRRAVDNVDQICAVPGLDMICLGPNDLALSLSEGQSRDIRAPAVLQAVRHVRARAEAAGVATFIFANDPDYARDMAAMGWQVIAIGTDSGWLSAAARDALPK